MCFRVLINSWAGEKLRRRNEKCVLSLHKCMAANRLLVVMSALRQGAGELVQTHQLRTGLTPW